MKLTHKCLLLSTALISLPTLAQGFYTGASIGYGNQQNIVNDVSTETGYLMAGYRFNNNIGAEYRFGGVNSHSSEVNNLKSYSSLYLRGSYELEQGFEIYGLVGLTNAASEDNFSNGSRNTTGPSFGLGARYEVTEGLGLNAEYVSVISRRDYSLSAVNFGIDYRF